MKNNKHIKEWYITIFIYIFVAIGIICLLLVSILYEESKLNVNNIIAIGISLLPSCVAVLTFIYTIERESSIFKIEKRKTENIICSSLFFKGVLIKKTLDKSSPKCQNIKLVEGKNIASCLIGLHFKANKDEYLECCQIKHFRIIVCKKVEYDPVVFEFKNSQIDHINFDKNDEILVEFSVSVNPRIFHEIFSVIKKGEKLAIKIKYDIDFSTLYGGRINKTKELIMYCKEERKKGYYFSNDIKTSNQGEYENADTI
ncbi:MAG: hypothetical protein MJ066_02590 [Clostridia bacterium]|nr:hypothetical protein [Clostridia bacterium]